MKIMRYDLRPWPSLSLSLIPSLFLSSLASVPLCRILDWPPSNMEQKRCDLMAIKCQIKLMDSNRHVAPWPEHNGSLLWK